MLALSARNRMYEMPIFAGFGLQTLNVLRRALFFLLLFFFKLNCVLAPTCAMGDTNELMEQVPYLATPPRNFTEIQDGEPNSSNKLLETNVPRVGMEFSSEEDAIEYYKAYALTKGFGICKGTTHNEKGERIHREIICSKEGFRKAKDQVSGKEFPESRCGCKAKLGVTRKADNKWVVTRFIDDYKYSIVSPRKACLIRSHRKLSSATKLMINSMTLAMVKPRHIHDIFIEQTGGIDNVICTQRISRMKMLYKMKESNPSFFYRLKLDEDSHILSILWVDATYKVSYQCFSDVVTFDTTYKTNSFSMSFAPILSVNHHFNTTFFGFALIFNEKVESFV
ncbi:hypothetical protein AMTRI_Chr05g61510 [Amborella trichopoda]